jgi:gliding motility-associated-like protein
LRPIFLIFLVPFFFLFHPLNAQQNNNWYFGRNAALSFNANGSQPIPVVLGNSSMSSNEAAASVSDANGDLLFYTNGVTVYNRNHQVMLNGDNLDGAVSACQVLIVPQPGNDSLFYIFTPDAVENSFQLGYHYSIVNINRDNGKGEIVTKNVLLWQSCTERITAVRHFNGVDVWVITNDNNSRVFRSWLITCSGLQSTPVVSTVGQVLNKYSYINCGVMKPSPDGKYICQTHFPVFDEINNRPSNFAQLFDFDNTTGILSNPRSFSYQATQYTHAEFSPDSKLLYLTRPYDKKIDQLEITLPTTAEILASRLSFPTNTGYYDIQMAPDEKIYVAHPSQYLSVINQPNVKGAGCNFVEDQIDLLPGTVFLGLPSFINDGASFDPNNSFNFTIVDPCAGTVQFNGLSTMPGVLTWSWDFGDGNTSSQQNPMHTFNPSNQAYSVKLKVISSTVCGYVQRARIIRPSGADSHLDFDYVNRCDSGYVRFINKSAFSQDLNGQLVWDFGDGSTSTERNPIHIYPSAGTYPVKLKLATTNPCLDDSITLNVDIKIFTINVSPDQTIVVGQSTQLSANGPATSYQWSPPTGLNNAQISNPLATPIDNTVYKLTATNADGCTTEDSVRVTVIQFNDIYMPTGFTPNNDGMNDQIKPFFGSKYNLTEFAVYSRGGQMIFSTRERGKGWDGKINGIAQNPGVYVWQLSLTEKSGAPINRKGTFVLIR